MADLSFNEMIDEVEVVIGKLMDKFTAKYKSQCRFECKNPDAILFSKKGTTAGSSIFNYREGIGNLNFNPIIMEDNWDKFIERTVPHEVAHWCVSLLYGRVTTRAGRRVIHGKQWKFMMDLFERVSLSEIMLGSKKKEGKIDQKSEKTVKFFYTISLIW